MAHGLYVKALRDKLRPENACPKCGAPVTPSAKGLVCQGCDEATGNCKCKKP